MHGLYKIAELTVGACECRPQCSMSVLACKAYLPKSDWSRVSHSVLLACHKLFSMVMKSAQYIYAKEHQPIMASEH